MAQTLGNINFGNIPVAGGGGGVVGADQGIVINSGNVELGSTVSGVNPVTVDRLVEVSSPAVLSFGVPGLNSGVKLEIDVVDSVRIHSQIGGVGQRSVTVFKDSELAFVATGLPSFSLMQGVGYPGTVYFQLTTSFAANGIISNNALRYEAPANLSHTFIVGADIRIDINDIYTQFGEFSTVIYSNATGGGLQFLDNNNFLAAMFLQDNVNGKFGIWDQATLQMAFYLDESTGYYTFLDGVHLGVTGGVLTVDNVTPGAAVLDGANYLPITINGISYKLALIV